MSETKKNGNNSDDYPLYMVMVMMPLIAIFIITSGGDPNSLLTDEQKIEKQKEIANKKEQKEKQWEEDKTWWKDGINYLIDEKPQPYVMLVGFVIFGFLIKGFTGRRYERGLNGIMMTPSIIIPIWLFTAYMLWVSGFVI